MRWKADRKGRMEWVNSDWENYSGIGIRRVEGTDASFIIHPDEREKIMYLGMSAWYALRPFAAKFRHWKDGRWSQVLVYTEPTFENGIFKGYQGITEPVSKVNECSHCPASGRFGKCCKLVAKVLLLWKTGGLTLF